MLELLPQLRDAVLACGLEQLDAAAARAPRAAAARRPRRSELLSLLGRTDQQVFGLGAAFVRSIRPPDRPIGRTAPDVSGSGAVFVVRCPSGRLSSHLRNPRSTKMPNHQPRLCTERRSLLRFLRVFRMPKTGRAHPQHTNFISAKWWI